MLLILIVIFPLSFLYTIMKTYSEDQTSPLQWTLPLHLRLCIIGNALTIQVYLYAVTKEMF